MRIKGSLVLVFVAAFTAGVLHGCGGSSGQKATPKCVLNSECSGNLVCALGFCVQQCTSSKDCSGNALCVKSDNGNVCRAPEVAMKCNMPSDCTKFCPAMSMDGGAADMCPLTCGRDLT
jgi:hypothetical protein